MAPTAPPGEFLPGGTTEPASEKSILEGRNQVRLVNRYPLQSMMLAGHFNRLAQENNFTAEEVDQVIFTQVRKPTIELAAKNCGMPVEKCHMIMNKWGYTGSACIPMALDDATSLGKVKSGDLVVIIGSGVGYNQAARAFRMM